jgi:hypothetical protein
VPFTTSIICSSGPSAPAASRVRADVGSAEEFSTTFFQISDRMDIRRCLCSQPTRGDGRCELLRLFGIASLMRGHERRHAGRVVLPDYARPFAGDRVIRHADHQPRGIEVAGQHITVARPILKCRNERVAADERLGKTRRRLGVVALD